MTARKFLEICSRCKTPTWCRTAKSSKGPIPICEACRAEQFFNAILYRPSGKLLLNWQRDIIRDIYGTLDIDTGNRVYQEAYITMAKKNGKSFLTSGMPLYHLHQEHETEDRPQAYSAAAAIKQASIVFDHAVSLVRGNPHLDHAKGGPLKIIESTKRIVRADGHGIYAVVSADGDLQDGFEPSLVVRDEKHRWKTKKASVLNEVLRKGKISRLNPLGLDITTAGEIFEAPIAYAEHQRAKLVASGQQKAPRLYVKIFEADPDRLAKDETYWESREARVAANPSHEDCGGFLKDVSLVEELERAQAIPSEKDQYLRYHLNQWVESTERHIPADAWAACGIPLRPLILRECYVGLDLSQTSDLTAAVFLFPDVDGSFDILPFFWCPEDKLSDLQRQTRQPFQSWAKSGLIEATPGKQVDYDAVRNKLLWGRENFSIREIDYDRRFAFEFVEKQLAGKDEFLAVKIPQGPEKMTSPMQRIVELLVDGKIRHGNHEILNWNADCLRAKRWPDGALSPVKPDHRRDASRIDGLASTLNALYAAMVNPVATKWDFQVIAI